MMEGVLPISPYPYNDMREARTKMMFEWLRAHGVETRRLHGG